MWPLLILVNAPFLQLIACIFEARKITRIQALIPKRMLEKNSYWLLKITKESEFLPAIPEPHLKSLQKHLNYLLRLEN